MATEEISCETKIKTKIRLNFKDLDKHYNDDGILKFYPPPGSSLKRKAHSYLIGKPYVIDYANNRKYIGFPSFGVKNLKCEFDLAVLLSNSNKIKIVESCNAKPLAGPLGPFGTKLRIARLKKESKIKTITGIMTLTFEVEDGVALKDELIYRFGEVGNKD